MGYPDDILAVVCVNHVASVPVSNAEGCIRACCENPNCNAINYRVPAYESMCLLKQCRDEVIIGPSGQPKYEFYAHQSIIPVI